MDEVRKYTVHFVGGSEPLHITGDDSILDKIKSNDWVQVGNNHIKTDNITVIVASEPFEEAKSAFFTSDDDDDEDENRTPSFW